MKIETNDLFLVFFDYVESVYPMSEEDKLSCKKNMKAVHFSRDSFLSQEGKIPQYHNFIVSGYARNYHYDESGKEITVDLSDGPRFFSSYSHFINRTISNENLQCVTDCDVLRVYRDDLEIMSAEFPSLNEYSTIILEQAWQNAKQMMIDRTSLSAENRYLKLLKESPGIIQHHQLSHIASYLGIRPGSLSRIRKDLSTSKA